MVRILIRGGSARTGRIGRHSTAGLAVVPAASLAGAQLDEGVGYGHPQLDSERGIVGRPVGEHGPRAWPGFMMMLCHTANTKPGLSVYSRGVLARHSQAGLYWGRTQLRRHGQLRSCHDRDHLADSGK